MDKIAVLDCGGQYAHLIGNRVRRLHVYSEILPIDVSSEKLKGYKGILLSGGPQSVYEENSPQCDAGIFELGIPVLGVCYGQQLMVFKLGGEVSAGEVKEYGPANLSMKNVRKGIFSGIEKMAGGNTTRVWMSHGDLVTKLPDGFEIAGSTSDCETASIANYEKNLFGIQFHFEVTHTEFGMGMLDNFLDICECERNWSIENYIEDEVENIKEKVGDNRVFLMISGGVDSTVAFLLLEKALGQKNVYGLFVDTGLMRKGERNEVEHALRNLGFENLHVYDASKEYFAELKDIYKPEEKRQIIGKLFLEIQAKVVKKLGLNPDEWLLGQGTIYPDTIESGGTKHASKIKTHHNRVPEIEELIKQGKIIEPLEQLYKDEVREVGLQLGLDEKIVWRHPFPGPGLGVRCLVAEDESYPDGYKNLENEIKDYLEPQKMSGKILPIQSVGVQGDARTYKHALALFSDKKSWKTLDEIATQLTNRFLDINRVVLSLSPEKFDWVHMETEYMTPKKIIVLQEADNIVNDFLHEKNINRDIWQFPTVLMPFAIENKKGYSVVLRPVCSQEAMTASFYRMDFALLEELVSRLMDIKEITGVFYDISNKPPGTIEWE